MKKLIGSNCTTSNDCLSIPNSECLVGYCKCQVSYGPSYDRKYCSKSKNLGDTCSHKLKDCNVDKLYCNESNICSCAAGFIIDTTKSDCIFINYCKNNLIYDYTKGACVKRSDFWFPTTHQNPKLTVITFVLLVFCFVKVLRSSSFNNSSYNNRRQRRSTTNINRNSFDLLSTIISLENNQIHQNRYFVSNNRNSRGRRNGENSSDFYFEENSPPPAYDEIFTTTNKNDYLRKNLKNDSINETSIDELNSIEETNSINQQNPINQLNSIDETISINETNINQAATISSSNEINNCDNIQSNLQLNISQSNLNEDLKISANEQNLNKVISGEENELRNQSLINIFENRNYIDYNTTVVINNLQGSSNENETQNLNESSLEDNKLPTYEEAITMNPM